MAETETERQRYTDKEITIQGDTDRNTMWGNQKERQSKTKTMSKQARDRGHTATNRHRDTQRDKN